MQRLLISRGRAEDRAMVMLARPAVAREEQPALRAVAPVPPSAPPSLDYHLVNDRLTALERLARLREAGILDEAEFAAEKTALLRLPQEELVLRPERAVPPRGPSLLGRMFGWKLISTGVVAGLCLSVFTSPQDLATLAERTLRLLG